MYIHYLMCAQAVSGLKEELGMVQRECGRLQLEADSRVLAKPSSEDSRPHSKVMELPRPPNELRSSGEVSVCWIDMTHPVMSAYFPLRAWSSQSLNPPP